MYVLVRFNSNWADEFDVEGIKLFTKDAWSNLLRLVEQYVNFPLEYYFGTNESFEWENFNEYRSCFSEQDITDIQANYLKEMLLTEAGYFPHPIDLFNGLPEEEEALLDTYIDI